MGDSLLKPPKIVTATLQGSSFTSSSLFLEGANFLRRQAESTAVSPEMEIPIVTPRISFRQHFCSNHARGIHGLCTIYLEFMKTYMNHTIYCKVANAPRVHRVGAKREATHCTGLNNDCVVMNMDERCEHLLPVSDALNLFRRPSSQLVAVGIMLCVPSLQLRLRHSDKLVSDGAILLIHHALLTDCISPPLGDKIDPEDVVNTAEQDAKRESVWIEYRHHS